MGSDSEMTEQYIILQLRELGLMVQELNAKIQQLRQLYAAQKTAEG